MKVNKDKVFTQEEIDKIKKELEADRKKADDLRKINWDNFKNKKVK